MATWTVAEISTPILWTVVLAGSKHGKYCCRPTTLSGTTGLVQDFLLIQFQLNRDTCSER